jgi:2-polyprenyl-6-methoxyphenol hydroxylase-like FAD-dependent oxidoreductase
VDISEILNKDDLFFRRIKVPFVSITFIQTSERATKERLQAAVKEFGWEKEAQLIEESEVIVENIDLFLQQAQNFSKERASALLVGDAAATASFFQGMGANTSLKTAEIAGRFFSKRSQNEKIAYEDFNREMKEVTDALIEDSRFLFTKK